MPALTGAVTVLAVTVLLVAGCGGATEPPSPPVPLPAPAGASLPPRPVELRLDGVDPCSLLTDHQRGQLGVGAGMSARGSESSPLKGDSCIWTNFPDHPASNWTGRTVLAQGADYALGREPPRAVDGFAATTTGSTGSDPAYYCLMLVDVAPDQSLAAQYDNGSKDYPGMNHQLACDKAQQLASDMLSTLRAIKRR